MPQISLTAERFSAEIRSMTFLPEEIVSALLLQADQFTPQELNETLEKVRLLHTSLAKNIEESGHIAEQAAALAAVTKRVYRPAFRKLQEADDRSATQLPTFG
ncbi:MAG: hypothetical protein WCG83_03775 [Candidatus Peregrinibacteria bacterium]